MDFYPESTLLQLEFDKIQNLLIGLCETQYAKRKTTQLRIHTHIQYIQLDLQQTHEAKMLLETGLFIPGDFSYPMEKELQLLGIPGAALHTEDFIIIRKLCNAIHTVFKWFNRERRTSFAALAKVLGEYDYEKCIIEHINAIIDEPGQVRDNASEQLQKIRSSLHRKRNELRKIFDRIVQKMNKHGYLADMEESFMNGRRVLAVFSEYKRMINGVLHGESDSRQTAYIEPEETTGLNNEVFSLENEGKKELYRILRELTAKLQPYAALLKSYVQILGEFDFIHAKAKLAVQMHAHLPTVVDKPYLELKEAYHPLLYLYNQKNKKHTIPISLKLDEKNRILVISGPNAGGKTVTMKTIGLIQVMLQSGLLVPVHPGSVLGLFKQLFIHIGDTQSIEFELSTYSSHLQHMKYFMGAAGGKTLFFIDELGSGSDPNLGGAFAEVIMEELARKHAFGIVTTHYLNLKIMASRVPGIINGAMQFDEEKLAPLYKLVVGKPGSSYTFSIAQRIGLPKQLIDRARSIIDAGHFKLDKLLNRTEQDMQRMSAKNKDLDKLLKENEQLKKEMQEIVGRERHRQQMEILRTQNKVRMDQLEYLRDMERKLKALVIAWRNTADKDDVVKMMHTLLFKQKEQYAVSRQQKKEESKYVELTGDIREGDKVKMKKNRQIGIVKQVRGKKAVVQVGAIPITIDLIDLVKLIDKPSMPEI